MIETLQGEIELAEQDLLLLEELRTGILFELGEEREQLSELEFLVRSPARFAVLVLDLLSAVGYGVATGSAKSLQGELRAQLLRTEGNIARLETQLTKVNARIRKTLADLVFYHQQVVRLSGEQR